MTDLDTLWRFVAITDLVVLLACGTALHLAYRRAMPTTAWRAGWGYGAVLLVVTIAIGVNAVLGEPLTPGQQLVTVGITPPTIWIGSLVAREVQIGWRAERDERRARVIARADEIVDWSVHVEHAEHCTNPECQSLRRQLLAITGTTPQRPADPLL